VITLGSPPGHEALRATYDLMGLEAPRATYDLMGLEALRADRGER
jgi:hypothetical protein